MNEKSRRNALKAMSLGVPAVWAKPVVDSVLLPAHAITTCSFCFTVSVQGSSGGGTAGLGIYDQNNSCELVGGDGAGGTAPFTSEPFCFDLAPGMYTLNGTGSATDGASTTVTARCCGDSETLGQGFSFSMLAVLEIFPDGSCSITNDPSAPCD